MGSCDGVPRRRLWNSLGRLHKGEYLAHRHLSGVNDETEGQPARDTDVRQAFSLLGRNIPISLVAMGLASGPFKLSATQAAG